MTMTSLPYAKDSDTSKAAAESMEVTAGQQESLVLAFLQGQGRHGATCDEVEVMLDLSHQSASARLRGLEGKAMVRKTKIRRPTRGRRQATVYVAVNEATREVE